MSIDYWELQIEFGISFTKLISAVGIISVLFINDQSLLDDEKSC